jgi:hypothetical protein
MTPELLFEYILSVGVGLAVVVFLFLFVLANFFSK